jgi:pyruvate/2-oxoglutarate dehydrogenase complex dihydrolipoamide acyltransferase (E2) component
VLDTPWRRLAATLFDAPHSGRILVRIEVDAEPVEAHLARSPGAQRAVGFLPFVAAAAARAIAEDVPALNGFLERGRVRARDGVTVSITAPVPGQGGLLALPLRDAHRRSATALAGALRDGVRAVRDRAKRGPLAEYVLAGVPWPLRRGVFRAARGLAHLGVPMGRFDLAPESYGALVVTSMEPLARGYDTETGAFTEAFVPLFPAARNASLVAVLPPREMPAAVDGALVVRRRAVLCFTFDHRLVDGLEVGAFVQSVHRRLQDPAALDRPLDPAS